MKLLIFFCYIVEHLKLNSIYKKLFAESSQLGILLKKEEKKGKSFSINCNQFNITLSTKV